jgi:hypothetical protein
VGGVRHPQHTLTVQQFPDINKLCNVASCWIYIGILLEAHPILHISGIRVKIRFTETGQWPKDFTEVTVTAFEKMPKATKCSDHGTVSLMVHTAKIVGRRVRGRIERKTEDVCVEDQFGTRKVNERGKKFG